MKNKQRYLIASSLLLVGLIAIIFAYQSEDKENNIIDTNKGKTMHVNNNIEDVAISIPEHTQDEQDNNAAIQNLTEAIQTQENTTPKTQSEPTNDNPPPPPPQQTKQKKTAPPPKKPKKGVVNLDEILPENTKPESHTDPTTTITKEETKENNSLEQQLQERYQQLKNKKPQTPKTKPNDLINVVVYKNQKVKNNDIVTFLTTKDAVYNNKHIPKNTIIRGVANISNGKINIVINEIKTQEGTEFVKLTFISENYGEGIKIENESKSNTKQQTLNATSNALSRTGQAGNIIAPFINAAAADRDRNKSYFINNGHKGYLR